LLATAALVEQLAAGEAESLAAVRAAVTSGTACLLHGPHSGGRLAERDPEGLLAELFQGRAVYERLLAANPTVYGQYGNGYSPLLPEVLTGLGFRGALQTSFDGSRVERPGQPRARWGARGGAAIEVLSTLPFDVADPRSAGVDVAVANGRLEGGADPFVERFRRLYVIVTVHECHGRVCNRRRFRVYEWMAGGFDELGVQAKALKLSEDPFGRQTDIAAVT
jgi:hypothetical protein